MFVYGGTILTGCHDDKKLDIVSVFEAVGARANDKIDDAELRAIEAEAISGSRDKQLDCERAGAQVIKLLELGLRPRNIMTRKAIDNAITVVIALGGTTRCCVCSPWLVPAGLI